MMNPPDQYPYNPRWWLAALSWTLALGLMLPAVAGYLPGTFGFACLGHAALGLLLALRRLAFPRSLVLDEEGIWLPSGFLRRNVRRVPFAEVSAAWEAILPFNTRVLCLRCRGKTFEVVSTLLPDFESYRAVVDLIASREDIIASNLQDHSSSFSCSLTVAFRSDVQGSPKRPKPKLNEGSEKDSDAARRPFRFTVRFQESSLASTNV